MFDDDTIAAPPEGIHSSAPFIPTGLCEPQTIPQSFKALGDEQTVHAAIHRLPPEFLATEDGIHLIEKKGDDDCLRRLCGPLIVYGRAHTHSGDDWQTCISFLNRDEQVISLVLPDADINGAMSRVIAQLVSFGFALTREKRLTAKLCELLLEWKSDERLTVVDQFGWTDATCSSFVVGDGRVIGTGKVLPKPSLLSAQRRAAEAQGTLEEWREQVSQLALGNPLMITAISLALSGPLLQPLGMEGGGLHIHGASSTGKSTLLHVANSVWTEGRRTQSWNSTKNALEVIAAQHSGRLLALDEIAEADPRTIGETVYALANGKGRGRLASNLERSDLSWQLSLISSGELSLDDHMGTAGKKSMAGQSVRMLNIPVDTEMHGAFRSFHGRADASQFAQLINQSLRKSYGLAGPELVRQLLSRTSDANYVQALCSLQDRIISDLHAGHDLPADGVTQRALQRFALIALAGEIATRFGITGWQQHDAVVAVKEVVHLWVLGRDLPTQTELDAVRKRIADYVKDHGFELNGLPEKTTPVPVAKLGWVDSTHYYFPSVSWARMHLGQSGVECAQLAYAQGGLRTIKGGLTYKMPRAIDGRPHVYAVRRAWLGAETTTLGSS